MIVTYKHISSIVLVIIGTCKHRLIGPSVLRAPAEQTKVATILGIFPLFLGPPLFKTTEGVVVGFQIFAWAPKKK